MAAKRATKRSRDSAGSDSTDAAPRRRSRKRVDSADNSTDAAEPQASPPADFETTLGEIKSIVARLESRETTLDDSLELYEKGIRELRACHALLESAEQRIAVLSGFDADGNAVTTPLDAMTPRQSGTKPQKSRPDQSGVDDSSGTTDPTDNDDTTEMHGLF